MTLSRVSPHRAAGKAVKPGDRPRALSEAIDRLMYQHIIGHKRASL
jgi:hypothetical protein